MLTKQMDFATSSSIGIVINELVESLPVKNNDNERKKNLDTTFKLRKNIQSYLKELEDITGRKISCHQKEFIKDYVYANEVYKINITEHNRKRKEFHHNCKSLRKEWEKETEDEWPTYKEDIYVNGKLWRMRGENYDAHHIVELSFNGPNAWYNIFPAMSPFEHPDAIHADNSVCTKIFGARKNYNKHELMLLEVDEEKKTKVKTNKNKPKVTKISNNVIRIN